MNNHHKNKASPTWHHSALGEFHYDGLWRGSITLPTFEVFAYETGYKQSDTFTNQYALTFPGSNPADPPSAASVAFVLKLLHNQTMLPSVIVAALWDDFNGRGPDSGMWWHSGMSEIAEFMPPPQSPEDLYAMMRLAELTVRSDEGPVLELTFWASFEEEHNVGILTDGERVLGTGYAYDVSPFEYVSDQE